MLGEPSFPQLRCLWSASKTAKAEQKKGNWLQVSRICNLQYLSGWWFQPLWKIWVRQLGWLFHSQLIWQVIKIHGSKAPTSGYIVVYSEFPFKMVISIKKMWFSSIFTYHYSPYSVQSILKSVKSTAYNFFANGLGFWSLSCYNPMVFICFPRL